LDPSFARQPEGNCHINRLTRTLKKQMLWRHRFRIVAEPNQGLCDFAGSFNNQWIAGLAGY
jgi:hypothetical protein